MAEIDQAAIEAVEEDIKDLAEATERVELELGTCFSIDYVCPLLCRTHCVCVTLFSHLSHVSCAACLPQPTSAMS